MDILDNDLVRKYFGCRAVCSESHFINVGYDEHERCMSTRILDAMQQPIRKGELYLDITPKDGSQLIVVEKTHYSDIKPIIYHPYYLRLPDAFQKQERKQHCGCACWCTEPHCFQAEGHKPTPAQEKLDKCTWCGGFNFHNEFCNRPVKPKDTVEEKIKSIAVSVSFHGGGFIENHLRDLVRIAKESVEPNGCHKKGCPQGHLGDCVVTK